MARAVILLGSNINPKQNIRKAVRMFLGLFDVQGLSSAWETPAIGASGPNFINVAIEIVTDASSEILKSRCLRPLEKRLGRVRTSDKYASRPIDLDVVVYDDKILEPKLWLQAYIALPVSEIHPEIVNSLTHQTIGEVANTFRLQNLAIYRPDILNDLSIHTKKDPTWLTGS